MTSLLECSQEVLKDLFQHLFEQGAEKEEGAFLLVNPSETGKELRLRVIELIKLYEANYVEQSDDYLELDEGTWSRVIKRAHSLRACIVEVHSHVGPWPAAFSLADLRGLRRTVPHVWWRLQNRPYLALVFTRKEFDALLWTHSPHKPTLLNCISSGGEILKPTSNSLSFWR